MKTFKYYKMNLCRLIKQKKTLGSRKDIQKIESHLNNLRLADSANIIIIIITTMLPIKF